MTYFSIKELESFSGIKAHTIRTWEQRFNFLQPKRSNKLRRTYSLEELKLILDISVLNRNGYKVSHIAQMDKLDIGFTLSSLSRVEHKREKAVNELVTLMAGLDTDGFEMVLQSCIATWGIDETITEIIIPFTQKAGMLQQLATKAYKPGLLLVEQCIKQKIILGIEKAAPVNTNKLVLFFLTKKSCELELLYIQYVLKSKGFATLFVSNFTSMQNLEVIASFKQPDFIITALPEKPQQFNIDGFLNFLAGRLPDTEFINLGHTAAVTESSKFMQSEQVEDIIDRVTVKDAVPAF